MRGDSYPNFIATIGYVRSLKIAHLAVYCEGKREDDWPCHHSSTMPIDGLPDEMTLVSIKRRLRCDECGTLGKADVRPDWGEVTRGSASGPSGWMTPPSGKMGD